MPPPPGGHDCIWTQTLRSTLALFREVFDTLEGGHVLAARPAFRYQTEGASWLVRSFYRARNRIPSTHNAFVGAGAFALSEEGHSRFGRFPSDVCGDDLFVDHQFLLTEKRS